MWLHGSENVSTPAKLQFLYEKTDIAPHARARERLFLGEFPAKMYTYNIASAAGASEENLRYFRQIST